jgi:hypothetical protein
MASPDQTVQPWMATAKKPIWKKWWVWLIVGFAALFILAGIFGSGGTDDASDSDEIVEEELDPMPDLLGERLDVALSDLETIGIPEDDVELVGGGSLGILDESNWIVCEQRPDPGETTLENLRLIVDRTCPEANAAEPEVTADENMAAEPEMNQESEETQEGAGSPESPAEFIVSANRDLRDIRKDLNDLETAFSEGGMLRVAGNQVELAFNIAQLNFRTPPEAFADEWTERLAGLSLAIDEIGNQLDADGSPQSVIDAIDEARAQVRATLGAVEDYESSLG